MKTLIYATTVSCAFAAGCGRKQPKTPTNEAPPEPVDVVVEVVPEEIPLANVEADGPNEGIANFRGFAVVQDLLRSRLVAVDAADAFDLGRYLDSPNLFRIEGLPALLGVQTGDGVTSGFRNGKANALSMALWHLTTQGVAEEAAAMACAPETVEAPEPELIVIGGMVFGERPAPEPVVYADGLLDELRTLCAGDTAALGAVWDRVISADAPQEERDAYLADFSGGGVAAAVTAAGGVRAARSALAAAMMNPHFLIRK